MIKLLKITSLSLLIIFIAPFSDALATDIPLLNWERGRVQEVVLGDTQSKTDWKLALVGKGTNPIIFYPSGKNDAGYIVYSAEIPASLPVGPYSLETSGGGHEASMVAGVNLIAATSYDIRKTITDLSLVIALLTFITVTFSVLRSKKYAHLVQVKEQEISYDELSRKDALTKVLRRLINLRKEMTREIKPSLFKHLLQQESESLFKLSRIAYFGLPLLGVIGGYWATSSASANKGIGHTSIYLFVAIASLGLIDSFSGIIATLSFWFIEFFYGNVSNLTQLMVVVAIGLTWAGPALFARVYLEASPKDFGGRDGSLISKNSKFLSALISSLVAGAIFYGGFKLTTSLIQSVDQNWRPNLLQVATISIIAFVKALFQGKIMAAPELQESTEDFEVVRVTSPHIALVTFLMIFGIIYVWTGNGLVSIAASIIFSAPYFLLFVRFEKVSVTAFAKLPRNIFIESSVAAGLSLLIFRQIQTMPQLADQKAEIFLVVAAIPVLLHGIYSSVCDSATKDRTIA